MASKYFYLSFLAGLAVGIWSDNSEIAALIPPRDRFEPQMDEEERQARSALSRLEADMVRRFAELQRPQP